jgi:hypothetical protein
VGLRRNGCERGRKEGPWLKSERLQLLEGVQLLWMTELLL